MINARRCHGINPWVTLWKRSSSGPVRVESFTGELGQGHSKTPVRANLPIEQPAALPVTMGSLREAPTSKAPSHSSSPPSSPDNSGLSHQEERPTRRRPRRCSLVAAPSTSMSEILPIDPASTRTAFVSVAVMLRSRNVVDDDSSLAIVLGRHIDQDVQVRRCRRTQRSIPIIDHESSTTVVERFAGLNEVVLASLAEEEAMAPIAASARVRDQRVIRSRDTITRHP